MYTEEQSRAIQRVVADILSTGADICITAYPTDEQGATVYGAIRHYAESSGSPYYGDGTSLTCRTTYNALGREYSYVAMYANTPVESLRKRLLAQPRDNGRYLLPEETK